MFRRRQRRRPHRWLREMLWPSSGWRRAGRYLAHRLARLPGSPHSIAAGLASGAAASFTPFLGLHFLLAALLAWLTRGNVLAAAIGTAVGNPWTFPLIWWGSHRLGLRLLGGSERGLPEQLTFAHVLGDPWDVLLPMAAGGMPLALLAWLAFYYPARSMVGAYQRRRAARLEAAHRRRVRGGVAS